MKITQILIIIISFTCQSLSSQNISKRVIQEYEDTLSHIAYIVMNGENETIREAANLGLISEMKEVLQYKESYLYPFDSLITISILSPEDKSFKIFNWILRKDNGEYKYYAIIIIPNEDPLNYIYELKDMSHNIQNPENIILNKENWYGCVYYDIIPKYSKMIIF